MLHNIRRFSRDSPQCHFDTPCHHTVMSSRTVVQLRGSPSAELAYSSALDILNGRFVDAAHLDGLQGILDDVCNTQAQLEQRVRVRSTILPTDAHLSTAY